MVTNSSEAPRLCLAGDWTVNGVAEKLPLLTHYIAHLTDTHSPTTYTAHVLQEIDLAGVTALDACGCQFLAQFSRSLRRLGLSPRIRNVPDAFAAKIRLLGFDRELNLSGETA